MLRRGPGLPDKPVPKRSQAFVADPFLLQRKLGDHLPQCPAVDLRPLAADDAIVGHGVYLFVYGDAAGNR
jgi:hypothetical protein